MNKKEIKRAQEHAVELRFYILNDLNVSLQIFNDSIYKKLMTCEWMYESGL